MLDGYKIQTICNITFSILWNCFIESETEAKWTNGMTEEKEKHFSRDKNFFEV